MNALKVRKCKGIAYKKVGSRDIFVSDLEYKLYNPLKMAMMNIKKSKNAAQLYNAAKNFNDMRIKMPSGTTQCGLWVDAYKGAGAFFTMQNLIRFHNCVAYDDARNRLDKIQSIDFILIKGRDV